MSLPANISFPTFLTRQYSAQHVVPDVKVDAPHTSANVMQSHASLTGFAREPRDLLVHEVNSALQLLDLEYLPRSDISHGQKNGLVILVQNGCRNRRRCWQTEKTSVLELFPKRDKIVLFKAD
jgi:hypothetical protein